MEISDACANLFNFFRFVKNAQRNLDLKDCISVLCEI